MSCPFEGHSTYSHFHLSVTPGIVLDWYFTWSLAGLLFLEAPRFTLTWMSEHPHRHIVYFLHLYVFFLLTAKCFSLHWTPQG